VNTFTLSRITADVKATLKYVDQFKGTTIVVKLGGSVLQDDELLAAICDDLATIRQVGISVVLVHGGGPAINVELERRGIQWSFIDGQRVTTPEMMEVIEMVLVGQVNRRIVRGLNEAGIKAVGFSGADASTLVCRPADSRLGQVGVIDRVNASLTRQVLSMVDDLDQPSIPVIAPIGLGRDGKAYNINADWAASQVASALGVKKMIFLTDQDGILDQKKNLLPELDAGDLEQLIEDGVVAGGMLAKTRTILHALMNQVTDIHILNARRAGALIEELFTDQGVGTVCRLRSRAHVALLGVEKC
jgi:acetylglutamate kinase